ncbi:hypothetical protein D3C72_1970660 [compost metagenome]
MQRTGEVVVDAAQDQFAAPALWLAGQLIAGQPCRANDAAVQAALRMMAQRFGDKADALIGHPIARRGIQINADDAGEFDIPASFFQRLAQRCLAQGFAGLEMAGGLIEHQVPALELFDEEKAALVFDDRGNGDVRMPIHVCVL